MIGMMIVLGALLAGGSIGLIIARATINILRYTCWKYGPPDCITADVIAGWQALMLIAGAVGSSIGAAIAVFS